MQSCHLSAACVGFPTVNAYSSDSEQNLSANKRKNDYRSKPILNDNYRTKTYYRSQPILNDNYRSQPTINDNYRPKAFNGYMKFIQDRFNRNVKYRKLRNNGENIRELIKNGRLLNKFYTDMKDNERLKRYFLERNLKNEIESVNIVPIQSNGAESIECIKNNEDYISCKQDDFEYNIKLKHKDLSQDNIENLIRSLYMRLSCGMPSFKDKRSACNNDTNDSPFMLILPPPKPTSLCNDIASTTVWMFTPCKSYYMTSTAPIQKQQNVNNKMIIECDPKDFEPETANYPRKFYQFDPASTTEPSAYIYSCRWQGKRQIETQNIIVPINRNQKLSNKRKVFKVFIDPDRETVNP
ncbi:hypothetical protein O3M35_001265 [Rhynocoris fuscipes]|uniref:Uncharacterized protein n=1 Tax=Rhynocoris fuscipes TaxID=488301 RepID=A0AAW1DQK1_9HEMI